MLIKSKLVVFTDETILVADGPNPEAIICIIEADLIIILGWLKKNKLAQPS
jgi:hypothetical protein